MKNNFLEVGDVVRPDKSWSIVNPGTAVPTLTQEFRRFSANNKNVLKTPVLAEAKPGNSLVVQLDGAPEFVVIKTGREGGNNDYRVTIKQLDEKGLFDSKGREFVFDQTGSNMAIKQVKPIRKMIQMFVAAPAELDTKARHARKKPRHLKHQTA